MSNIIDKIQLSGVTYDIGGQGSGVSVVEVTQAEYDALPSSAKTDTSKMYVITDAEAGDLSQYWTSAQTQSAIIQATSGKVETSAITSAVTSASTDSEIPTAKAVWDAIPTGGTGGGKAIEAGRGISVTTGETADTVSFNLPMSADTIGLAFFDSKDGGEISTGNSINKNNIVLDGYYNKIGGNGAKRVFSGNFISGWSSKIFDNTWAYDQGATFNIIFGHYNTLSGNGKTLNSSIIVGDYCYGYATEQSLFGDHIYGRNEFEHAVGRYNVSSSASTTFGDSGNTLFSVGNGTSNNARHNAFEIRQNGDIYLTSGGTDIKLQDHLGGGSSYTAGTGIDITNDVISVTGKVDTATYSTYTAATDAALATKQATLTAGTGISIVDNVISATGGGGGGEVSSAITSGDTNAVAGGAVFDAVVYSANTYTTELTFDANGYAENWIVGQSAITIDVSGYTSDTSADYYFQNSNGEDLGYAHIYKTIGSWGGNWHNEANNCTITTDGDTATTATITDIPSGTVKIRRRSEINPPKAIISGDTPEIWIKDALDDHRDNTTVHITAAERTSWNNKSNFSGSYNDLTDKPIPDSALNVASTNPVQNQALFSELRIDGEGETETTLTFEGNYSTNYIEGCTKIKVENISSSSMNTIAFYENSGRLAGNITISNWGSISVDTSYFQGATYEISGSTVIISYPSVTTVYRLRIDDSTKYTYKAVTSSTTPLKDQVVTNTAALGGLSLVKLTQAQYDALVTKDSNTLYVIVN